MSKFNNDYDSEVVNRRNYKNLEKLKSLSSKIDWPVKKRRCELMEQFYSLIVDWKGQFPNLRAIFRRRQIEYILSDALDDSYTVLWDLKKVHYRYRGEPIIKFIASSGYRDEPSLDKNGEPVLRRTTPLHRAAESLGYGGLETLGELFEIYGDTNYADKVGLTHFHVACKFGFEAVVERFLERGRVDPNCLWLTRHPGVFQLLLRAGADPNLADSEGTTPLHVVCRGDAASVVLAEMLLDARPPVRVDARDNAGNTALLLALKACNGRVAETLLRRGGADPNTANERGETPLHVIGWKNYPELMELFFEITGEMNLLVQLDAKDKLGNTPLHQALKCHGDRVIEPLLRRGADANLADANGSTPLHIICDKLLDVISMKSFFEINDDIDNTVRVDARDNLGNTPLHLALAERLDLQAELLLRRGADPNAANDKGETPLHVICAGDHADILAEVLFKTCDSKRKEVTIDARDKLGRTPLQLAVANFLPGVIDALLNNGADLSDFVFPDESQLAERWAPRDTYCQGSVKWKLASGCLAVVEQLESRGYEMDRGDAAKVAKFFLKHGLFDEPGEAETPDYWYDDERIATITGRIKVTPDLSLYDLIGLRDEETRKLQYTYADYFKFARTLDWWRLPVAIRETCYAHLCRTMSRGFFRSWAIEGFMKLTDYRLPLECCNMIVDESLTNKEFCNICLAATMGQSL